MKLTVCDGELAKTKTVSIYYTIIQYDYGVEIYYRDSLENLNYLKCIWNMCH